MKILLPAVLLSPTSARQPPARSATSQFAADESRAQAPQGTDEDSRARLGRVIKGQPLLEDLEQVRALLKREWILSNLNDADFDGAIDGIAGDAKAGMTVAELTFRLQRVLAMGSDGHAEIAQFRGALTTIPGVRPDFLIDVDGDDYTAYRVEAAPGGPINPKFEHKFAPLKEGFPRLLSIDGKPISEWVRAAEPYIPRGSDSALRWRAMYILQELPFLRRALRLPNAPTIPVRLASADRKSEVEFDAPTNKYQRFHFAVPKPECRILDGNIGYLWISDPSSNGTEIIINGMPKLRETRGLVLDLRDNEGGAGLETLKVIVAYLLPHDRPRRAIGELVHWRGDVWKDDEVSTHTRGLSAEGRRLVSTFQESIKRTWQPPKGRATESRTVFLARAEAEPELQPYDDERFPKTYAYTAPVVVLFNQRCFSAAEIFLAGIREVDGVTLVGSTSTVGGGGSSEQFRLRNSGLDVCLSRFVFVRADGTLIDGRGIMPDVVVEPDSDYYLGVRDRMLEQAVTVLTRKIDGRK